ncbi:hypothetical protein SHIRM173S_03672 [Streptomyces hirsutus]
MVKALRDLGVPALARAIKEMGDAGASMLGPIRIAGCGVEVDVTLPSGVATNEVQNRRGKLAENLARHEHEVFITIPEAARTVRLWIADSGALDEPIGPSPLVTDESLTANYKSGKAPWGQDLRGDAAALSLYQRHLLVTGLSNQGKTASLRALALWLALDRSVQFWIADLKGIGDWAMFEGIAQVLIEGPSDDHVIQATEMVEDAVEEMNRRIETRRNDPTAVFPPLIVLVDEAQLAFMCPVVGETSGFTPRGGLRYYMAAQDSQPAVGRRADVAGHAVPHRSEPSQARARGRPHPGVPRGGRRGQAVDGARAVRGRRRRRPGAPAPGPGQATLVVAPYGTGSCRPGIHRSAPTSSATSRPLRSRTGPRPCATAPPPCA